jgi:transcriptional regulator with XRE-family HTH domain
MDNVRALFGKRVRKLRKAEKLSLEKAAERARLSGNYWGEVERGRKVPSLETIASMARALDVPAHHLLLLEREEGEKALRGKLDSILSRSKPQEIELIYRVVKAIVEP